MIDPDTGEVVLEQGTRIGPKLSRSEFLALGLEPEPFAAPSWLRLHVRLSTKEPFVIVLRFEEERLAQLDLVVDDPAFSKPWDVATEKARARWHAKWLQRWFGTSRRREYAWGKVASWFDARGCSAGITLSYGHPKPEATEEVYDKAKYHLIDGFPEELDKQAALVPTGLFLGWLIEHDLTAKSSIPSSVVKSFKARRRTGPAIFERELDGVLSREDLTDQGNLFAIDYFGEDFARGRYLKDLRATAAKGLPSVYHVADNWESFDRICARIDERYRKWRERNRA